MVNADCPLGIVPAWCHSLCMPKRSSKKRPADTNRLAHQIVQESLGEALPNEGKAPAVVALGRKGGLKGGKARAG